MNTILQKQASTITSRQRQVLDFITAYLDNAGYPPSQREIAHHLGVSGTLPVSKHLTALEKKGCLRLDTVSRGIRLANQPARSLRLPILGCVRAGQPEEAVENIQGYCSTDPAWIRGADCFYLRVTGDSMIEAGIREGDLALIRSQTTAENGEIIVALVDGEATIKYLYREKGYIRLQPANGAMQPIIIHGEQMADVIIIGKLLKIIRDYN